MNRVMIVRPSEIRPGDLVSYNSHVYGVREVIRWRSEFHVFIQEGGFVEFMGYELVKLLRRTIDA